ncbi:CCA tRNA nucleotidyltransferase [Pseudalkalibacillus hwajinpoensis]|uniref:CCA tRNA nucleotidyltransferase n=1 Tax=Guptibacillus hwajinpoensis TaxID=208199 RepID=UPI001CFD887E|nr:CCA tRNA nucleotidyltransferase [Pseudalkalibacillus hwajinpoensis]
MIQLTGKAYQSCVEVLQILTNAGFEAYIVGGAVRDAMLGLPVSDFDLASSAKPQEVMDLFQKVIPTGIDHGTVTVMHRAFSYEVTTFRTDASYTDFRHPNAVSYLGSIEEDLARRDFTMNSMALSLDGTLIDLYGGQEDIKNGLIRTVGNPLERFQEDALRMIRAVRFQSTLDFSLDKQTEEALKKQADLLKYVAVERIQAEFSKLLAGKGVQQALITLIEANVHHILPGIQQIEKSFDEVPFLVNLSTEVELWAWLASTTEDPKRFLKRWRLSNRFIKEVDHLLENARSAQAKGWNKVTVYTALPEVKPCERLLSVFEKRLPVIKNVERITSELPITSSTMLAVTGEDLIQWREISAGPWVGEALRELELAVINEEIKNEKSSIRRWLKQWQTQ